MTLNNTKRSNSFTDYMFDEVTSLYRHSVPKILNSVHVIIISSKRFLWVLINTLNLGQIPTDQTTIIYEITPELISILIFRLNLLHYVSILYFLYKLLPCLCVATKKICLYHYGSILHVYLSIWWNFSLFVESSSIGASTKCFLHQYVPRQYFFS